MAEQRPLIHRLRALRKRSVLALQDCRPDMDSYLHPDGLTYVQLPSKKAVYVADPSEKSVTSTCTVLMALAQVGTRGSRAERERTSLPRERVVAALNLIWETKWESSGLAANNAFSSALVLRAVAVLSSCGVLERADIESLTHPPTPPTIDPPASTYSPRDNIDTCFNRIYRDVPDSFVVGNYPPSPTIAYWLVDATARLRKYPADHTWNAVAAWAGREFARQHSRAAAGSDATADPIAMAMAGCVVARIRRAIAEGAPVLTPEVRQELPSAAELARVIRKLFEEYQRPSGIWVKYFPLFHYPEGGANHCFAFELLEAVLAEFGNDSMMKTDWMLSGLEKSMTWCESQRIAHPDWRGWNSGGRVDAVLRDEPESWATGVVHMFLLQLGDKISHQLRTIVLDEYSATSYLKPSSKRFDEMLNMDLQIDGRQTSIKAVIRDHILDPLSKLGATAVEIPSEAALSALLFGPPGTSKTEIAKAVAKYLGWDFVEINPSNFLGDGLDGIYPHSSLIFEDLADIHRAVVLFDELDGLVHARNQQKGSNDTTLEVVDPRREFLTTSMLPKLTRLHDQRKVVFFWATNYLHLFDPAIRRSGRFDLLLQVGPPTLDEKLSDRSLALLRDVELDDTMAPKENAAEYRVAAGDLRTLVEHLHGEEKAAFERFTFGDMKALLNALCGRANPISLAAKTGDEFEKALKYVASTSVFADEEEQKLFRDQQSASRVQH
jgi:hypothetical protein